MHRLHSLGSVDLRNPAGNPVGPVLAQPKRLALLIYLAAAGEGRYCRRDTLLGVFWPEFDEEHARGALRKALHYLKQSLGPDVIVRRGVEELSVDPSHLSLDTFEFERAIADGRLEDAVELYRGEFLPGFILDDAPQFEHWLSGERRRFHQLAVQATGELADRSELAGKADCARQYAEAALALAPTGENEVRRLIMLLDRAGDRATALRTYASFAARLREEFGVEPSPETRELVGQIRARDVRTLEVKPAAPAIATTGSKPLQDTNGSDDRSTAGGMNPMAEVSGSTFADSTARPLADTSGHGSVVSGTRRLGSQVWAAVIAALLLVAGAAIWSRSHPPVEQSTHLAVLPFEVQAATPLNYLDEGLAVLLAMRLDGGGGLRTIEPTRVLQHVAKAGRTSSMREVARKAGAGLYVTGHVTQVADRISVEAALYSTASERPIARARAVGAEAALLILTDSIAQQLLAAHLRDRGLQLSESAALSTSSLEALKEYLEGEEQLRAGRYEVAVEWYQRAINTDSTFALAHFRHAVSANWLGRMRNARESVQQAERYSSRLNEHGRQLVRGLHAELNERFADAERIYQETVSIYPNDTEAWFGLGDAIFHGRPPSGGSIAAARAPFEQALRLDPNHLASLVHLTRIAAWEGSTTEVDSLTIRILRDQRANDHYAEALLFRVAALRDQEAGRKLVDLMAGQPMPARLLDAAWRVAAYAGEPGPVDSAVRVAFPDGAMPEYEAGAALLHAHLATAYGNRAEADEQLRQLERSVPATTAVTRALFALQPGSRASTNELVRLRSTLDQAKARRITNVGFYIGSMSSDTIPPWVFDYYSAQLSLRLGQRTAAEEKLKLIPQDYGLGGLAHAQVQALLLEDAGDLATATRLLESEILRYNERPWSSVIMPRAASRVTLARLLEAAGKNEEAHRWRASVPQDFSFDVIYRSGATP